MLKEVIQLFDDADVEARLISAAAPQVANDGVSASVDAVLDLEIDDKLVRFAVEIKSRAPYPGEIQRLEMMQDHLERIGVPLLVAPFISEPTGKALSEARWSWADAQGNADIRARGIRFNRRVSSRAKRDEKRGIPGGTGSWAIIRSLIAHGRIAGATEFAEQVGVSQPRLSQVLSELTVAGYIKREGRTTWIADRPALMDAFLESYSGARGTTSWLYSLDPLQDACEHVVSIARSSHSHAVISGDVAADRLAPWRVPTQATVYAADHLVVARLDMEAAQGPGDANVELIVPSDTSVFQAFGSGDPSLVHPTQVIWDLQRLGGADRQDVAERLKEWLLSP